ncbi:MAG: cyclic nucleotide-binding domain-containing protein [Spirochaetales bacterium]|nr:cyclic nucleotide-binding domain-containing protein [Spirochaetales bacterium]
MNLTDDELRALAERRLGEAVPFRFLPSPERKALAAEAPLVRLEAGQDLFRLGKDGNEAYVLLEGSMESLDTGRSPPFRVNVIEPGSLFGERSSIFDLPRKWTARALEPSACLALGGERFLALVSGSRAFAQSLGAKLRDGQGIFDAFDHFLAEIQRAAGLGHIEIRRFMELYKKLEPAIHAHAGDESLIDWDALLYAARRLPENVSRTFLFLLTDNLPVVYASPELLFPAVPTEARRRFVYEMLGGKDMALVRTGLSDLLDFVTCLCLYAVETRKIRYRLNHPDLILALANHAGSKGAAGGDDEAFLARLPFDGDERRKLVSIWPVDTVDRIRELAFHRQVYSVDVRKQVNNYNGRLSELWTARIGAAAAKLLGVPPADFPEDWEVHIVSSNTHSVSNCLNPYFRERRDEILAWADGAGLRIGGWDSSDDEIYHLARRWFETGPDALADLASFEARYGIERASESVTTGIQAQIIDLERLRGAAIDPLIRRGAEGKIRRVVVNVDYAFGEQAEEIMKNLLMLFGRNVRSVNVLGKAGGLAAGRGDVVLPTAFVEQRGDAFMPVAWDPSNSAAALRKALPGRRVVTGPLLTVAGTLLQNRMMLNFYRRLWECVGLEMEGIWYLRALTEGAQLGVLRQDVAQRFYYYVSDAPLDRASTLAARMGPIEGLPPLYAITREVLTRILSDTVDEEEALVLPSGPAGTDGGRGR